VKINNSLFYGLTFVLNFILYEASAMPSLLPLKYKYLERLYDTHSFTFGKFTITPICTGFISTRHHRNWEEPEAVFIWLLQSDSESILIDTGLSDKVNGTQYFPAFLNFYFRNKYKFYLPPHRLENDPYQKVFSNTASINTVLLTHAHFDHTGMLANFVKSNIVVSQKEFKAA
jgi:glyoxylase-like metal-dependent hydrolase (beta-lactamase superfamily II)